MQPERYHAWGARSLLSGGFNDVCSRFRSLVCPRLSARSLARSLARCTAVVYAVVGGERITELSARSLPRSVTRSLTSERWYMGWWVEDGSVKWLLARSHARSLAHSWISQMAPRSLAVVRFLNRSSKPNARRHTFLIPRVPCLALPLPLLSLDINSF